MDYSDTYSPVMKAKAVTVLFALAVEMGWEMHHLDIVSAYLNDTLKETVYMEQLPNFDDLKKPRGQYAGCEKHCTVYISLGKSGIIALTNFRNSWVSMIIFLNRVCM